MKSSHKTQKREALIAALHLSEKLETEGRFEEAEALLAEIPRKNLPKDIRAELNLRHGAIRGFLQNHAESKRMLFSALRSFEEAKNDRKIAESRNYLALAFWRSGELYEARVWLELNFEIPLEVSSRPILHSFVINGIIELDEKRYSDLVVSHLEKEQLFLSHADDYLKGCFFNNLAYAQRNLGELENAIAAYEKAHKFILEANNRNYLGGIENNLAYLFFLTNQFPLAIEYGEKACETFRQCKNAMREASALDTLANIHLGLFDFEKAHGLIERSVAMLRESGNHLYLLESLQTRIKIDIARRDFESALLAFGDAYTVATVWCGEQFTKEYAGRIKVLLQEISTPFIREAYMGEEPSFEDLYRGKRVEFSREISAGAVYCVKMETGGLETAGLAKGDVVALAEQKINEGDLCGVLNYNTGNVGIGYFEFNMGMIILHTPGREPIFYEDRNCKILGRLIGKAEYIEDGDFVKVEVA